MFGCISSTLSRIIAHLFIVSKYLPLLKHFTLVDHYIFFVFVFIFVIAVECGITGTFRVIVCGFFATPSKHC